MGRFFLPILFILFLAGNVPGQVPADTAIVPVADSLREADTINTPGVVPPAIQRVDSFSKQPTVNRTISPGISFSSPEFGWEILRHHPYFGFNKPPVILPASQFKKFTGKELVFYLLVFLFLVFAFLRNVFPKYFNDLFRLFFRTTLKQRQIREQLMQTPLPSLLMNGFFVLCGGLYIAFLLEHYGLNPVDSFWLLFFYCCVGLTAAYFIKFIGLKVSGWLFNMTEAADSYIFIVFIVNKMIGMMLLPFLVLLAFSSGDIYSVALTLSWAVVAGLLVYRFILTFAAVRNQVTVNPFHFFLYILAFEIAPLLLVYKGLLLFFRITA